MAIVEQEDLEKERNLWNLIYLLYSDEQNSTKDFEMANEEDKENDENKIGFNEAFLIERLERKNPLFRRVRIVIEWLEQVAFESNSLKVIKEKISEFPEKCLSWEHTSHQLKNLNSFNKKDKTLLSNREYVDELVIR